MPKLVDAAAQRREIRDAARRVFARRGVEGTGLAHVADAAGMGRSSLYHYYPDKPSLLRDLVKGILDEELAVFVRVLRGAGSPEQRVERLLRGLVEDLDAYASGFRMVFELRLRSARRFRPFFRRIRSELATVIREGQRGGAFDAALDPERAAAALIGAVDGLLLQHFVDPDALAPLPRLGDELARIARKALAP